MQGCMWQKCDDDSGHQCNRSDACDKINQGFFSQSDKPGSSHLKQAISGNSKSHEGFDCCNPGLSHAFFGVTALEGVVSLRGLPSADADLSAHEG